MANAKAIIFFLTAFWLPVLANSKPLLVGERSRLELAGNVPDWRLGVISVKPYMAAGTLSAAGVCTGTAQAPTFTIAACKRKDVSHEVRSISCQGLA